MAPPMYDAEEYERFWRFLRQQETKLENLCVQVSALQLDLDSERKRSIAVHRSSGRSKWTALASASVTIIIAVAEALRHVH